MGRITYQNRSSQLPLVVFFYTSALSLYFAVISYLSLCSCLALDSGLSVEITFGSFTECFSLYTYFHSYCPCIIFSYTLPLALWAILQLICACYHSTSILVSITTPSLQILRSVFKRFLTGLWSDFASGEIVHPQVYDCKIMSCG